MISIINSNLFGITETNNEQNPKERNIIYSVPARDDIENVKHKKEDGTYELITQQNFFKLSGEVNGHGGYLGKLKLKPKPAGAFRYPSGTHYINDKMFDGCVGLIAFTYGGIILPVRGNAYCRIMNGTICAAPNKAFKGCDQKNYNPNALYLVLDINVPVITKSVKNCRRYGSSVTRIDPEVSTPLDILTDANTLMTTEEYQEIMAFTLRHLYHTKDGKRNIVQETFKVRAYVDTDTDVITLKLSERPEVYRFPEDAFADGFPPIPTDHVFELHQYPVKPKTNGKFGRTDRKPKYDDKKTGPDKKKPYRNDKFGSGRPPFNKNKNDKKQGNKTSNNTSSRKPRDNNKPDTPRYNKNGILIANKNIKF